MRAMKTASKKHNNNNNKQVSNNNLITPVAQKSNWIFDVIKKLPMPTFRKLCLWAVYTNIRYTEMDFYLLQKYYYRYAIEGGGLKPKNILQVLLIKNIMATFKR